ncbi:hypothetical protein BVX97_00855, partial [bacterium E08(2017)]
SSKDGVSVERVYYKNPVAYWESLETDRLFFNRSKWYKVYRVTGDERLLDRMHQSAKKSYRLCVDSDDAALRKGRHPEGLMFMFDMIAWSRLTLQKARKYPGKVSQEEIAEAEKLLKAVVQVLKPTLEGDDLDPAMGIPRKLADDYRFRAFNRAMNGIGAIAMTAVALEDLQKVRNTTDYKSTIDRYRKAVKEYVKYWHNWGDFVEIDGKTHFYYPYAPRQPEPQIVDGQKVYKRPEDLGHYSHSVEGATSIFESTPELGVDDDFMTAMANALHHNATVKVKFGNKLALAGYAMSPAQARTKPLGGPDVKKKFMPARGKVYPLQAFRDDFIDTLC